MSWDFKPSFRDKAEVYQWAADDLHRSLGVMTVSTQVSSPGLTRSSFYNEPVSVSI